MEKHGFNIGKFRDVFYHLSIPFTGMTEIPITST